MFSNMNFYGVMGTLHDDETRMNYHGVLLYPSKICNMDIKVTTTCQSIPWRGNTVFSHPTLLFTLDQKPGFIEVSRL